LSEISTLPNSQNFIVVITSPEFFFYRANFCRLCLQLSFRAGVAAWFSACCGFSVPSVLPPWPLRCGLGFDFGVAFLFRITQSPSYPFTKSLLTSRSLVTAVTSSESPGVKAISEVFHPVNLNHFFKKGETQWQTLFAEIRLLSSLHCKIV
jgi:hypothetical protein